MKKSRDWGNYWKFDDETDNGGVIYWVRIDDDNEASEHMPLNMNQNDSSLCIGTNTVYKWYSKKIDADGKEGDWGEY